LVSRVWGLKFGLYPLSPVGFGVWGLPSTFRVKGWEVGV